MELELAEIERHWTVRYGTEYGILYTDRIEDLIEKRQQKLRLLVGESIVAWLACR